MNDNIIDFKPRSNGSRNFDYTKRSDRNDMIALILKVEENNGGTYSRGEKADLNNPIDRVIIANKIIYGIFTDACTNIDNELDEIYRRMNRLESRNRRIRRRDRLVQSRRRRR